MCFGRTETACYPLPKFRKMASRWSIPVSYTHQMCIRDRGGGATGIELAGALAEMRKFVLPQDLSLIHICGMEQFRKRYIDNGMIDFLVKEREAGRIRRLG